MANNSNHITSRYGKWITNKQRERLRKLYKGYRQSTAGDMRSQYLNAHKGMYGVRTTASAYGLGEGYVARKKAQMDSSLAEAGRQYAAQADAAFENNAVRPAANATIQAENERKQREHEEKLRKAREKAAKQAKAQADFEKALEEYNRNKDKTDKENAKRLAEYKKAMAKYRKELKNAKQRGEKLDRLPQRQVLHGGQPLPKGLSLAADLHQYEGATSTPKPLKPLPKGKGKGKGKGRGGVLSDQMYEYESGTGHQPIATSHQGLNNRPVAPKTNYAANQTAVQNRKKAKEAVVGKPTKPILAIDNTPIPVPPHVEKDLIAKAEAMKPEEIPQLKNDYINSAVEHENLVGDLYNALKPDMNRVGLAQEFSHWVGVAQNTALSPAERKQAAMYASRAAEEYNLQDNGKAHKERVATLTQMVNDSHDQLVQQQFLLQQKGVRMSEDEIGFDTGYLRQYGAIPAQANDTTYAQAQALGDKNSDLGKQLRELTKMEYLHSQGLPSGQLSPQMQTFIEENNLGWLIDQEVLDRAPLVGIETAIEEKLKKGGDERTEYLQRKGIDRVQRELSTSDPEAIKRIVGDGDGVTHLKDALERGGDAFDKGNTTMMDRVESYIQNNLGIPSDYLNKNTINALRKDEASVAFIDYCYATGQADLAKQFLFDLTEAANKAAGEKQADKISNLLPDGWKWIPEFMYHLGYGASNAIWGKIDFFRGKTPTRTGAYTQEGIIQNEIERWTDKLGKTRAENRARTWANALTSAGENFTDLAIGTLAKGALGAAGDAIGGTFGNIVGKVAGHAPGISMGWSAAGSAKQEMLKKGYSDKAATIYGIFSGVSEAVLQEQVGGLVGFGDRGAFTKALSGLVDQIPSAAGRTAINAVLDVASEIGQEEFGNILDSVYRSVALGEGNDVYADFKEQFNETAVTTAISTLLLNALHIPTQIRNERGYSAIADASGMSLNDAKFLLETDAAINGGERVDPNDILRYNELTANLMASMPDNVVKSINDGKMTLADWVTSNEGIVQGKLTGKLTESDTKTEAAKNPVTGAEIKAIDHTEALKGKTDEQRRDYLLNAAPTGKAGSAYYTTTNGKAIDFKNLDTTQKANYVLAQKCAKAFEGSVDVVIHDTLPLSNGAMVGSDGKLHIALDVTNEQGRESIAYWTLAHEAGHALKIADSKAWNEMFDVLTDYAKNHKDRDGKNLYDALVDSITNQYKYDNDSDAFNDEMFSLIAERMVGSEGEQWAATLGDNTIFDAIANDKNASAKAKRGFLGKLKTSVEKLSRQFRDGGFSKERKRLAKIREQLTEAYKRINEVPSIRDAAVARQVERKAHEEARKLREQTERREGFQEGLKAHDAEFNKQKEVREKKARDDALLEEILKGFEEEDKIKAAEETESTRFQTRATDAEYLSLAEKYRDGTATEKEKAELEKRVEEAAKEAGYTIKAYHATNNNFTVFDKAKRGKQTDFNASSLELAATAHIGFWFNNNDVSGMTGQKRAIASYLNLNNPLEYDSLQDLAAAIREGYASDWDELDDDFYVDDRTVAASKAADAFVKKMLTEDHDGVVINDEEFGGVSYAVLDSSQIKSADPVTYDSNGDIIPLSERFRTDREGDEAWKNEDIRFSLRTAPAPKKTQDVYKLMRLGKDGKLYPLFIDSANGIEVGKWYDADSPDFSFMQKMPEGVFLVDTDTQEYTPLQEYQRKIGDKKSRKFPAKEWVDEATKNGQRWVTIEPSEKAVKRYEGENRRYYNIGINGSGSVSTFAMRPGWHAGSLPTMRQIGKGSGKNLRDDSFVWVKGRVPADIDYQAEAERNIDKDIPTHIPKEGYYLKATNANAEASQADRVGWYVAGSFIADEIIGDIDARNAIDAWNDAHPADEPVEYDFERESGKVFNAKTMSLESSPRYQQRDFRIDFNVPQLDTKALHEAVKGGEGTVENRFEVKYEKTDSGFAVHITDKDSGKTYDRAEIVTEGNAKAEAERAAAAVIRNIKRGRPDSKSTSTAGIYHEKGEIPARDVNIPVSVKKGMRTSKLARTIAEASGMTEESVDELMDRVYDGFMSYKPDVNQESMDKALAKVEDDMAGAVTEWNEVVNKGKILSPDDVALGSALMVSASQSGNINEAMEIAAQLQDLATTGGKLVQSFRMIKRLGAAGAFYYINRQVAKINAELKKAAKGYKIEINQDLVNQLLAATDYHDIRDITEEIRKDLGRQLKPTLKDWLTAWRYTAMLGNLRTLDRNLLGNAGFIPIVMMKNVVNVGLQGAAKVLSGGKFQKTARLFASKQYTDFAKWDWNDQVKYDIKGNKYNDEANEIKQYMRYDTGAKGVLKIPAKVFNAWRSATTHAMEDERLLGDMAFKKAHYDYSLATRLQQQKVNTEMLKDVLARSRNGEVFKADSEEARLLDIYNKASEYAQQEANRNTYNDINAFARYISQMSKRAKESNNKVVRAAHYAIEGILPFKNTPANIISRAVEYSPIGIARTIAFDIGRLAKGRISGEQFIENLAKGITGSGLFALGAILAKSGILRGALGYDDDEDKDLKRKGHQSYSIEIFDKSITLDWLAPECIPLFMGVEFFNQMGDMSVDVWNEKGLKALLNVTTGAFEPMLNMSMLQGVNALFEGFKSKDDLAGLSKAVATIGTSYLTQFEPTLFGQFARTLDPYRRSTYIDKNSKLPPFISKFWQTAIKKIPGATDTLLPYVNEWGEKEKTPQWWVRALENFLSPAYINDLTETDVDREISRLFESTAETGAFPDSANKYISYNGERYDLTQKEYEQYAVMRGETAYALAQEMIGTQWYNGLSDVDKVAAFADAYAYADTIASSAILDGRLGANAPDLETLAKNKNRSWVSKANVFAKTMGTPDALSQFIALRQTMAGMTGGRDARAEYLNGINELSSEAKALLMGMHDTSEGYADGTAFYNKNGKLIIDFANPGEAAPAELPATSTEDAAAPVTVPAPTAAPAAQPTAEATAQPKSDKYTKAAEKWAQYGVTQTQAKSAVEKWDTLKGSYEGSRAVSEYRTWLTKQNLTGRQRFAMFSQANADLEKKATEFNKKYGTKYEALWNAYTKYNGESFHGEEYRSWVEKQTSDYYQRFALVEFAEPRSNWIEHAEELHKAGASYKAVWEAARYAKNQSGQGKKDRIIAYAKKLGMTSKQAENIYKWFG